MNRLKWSAIAAVEYLGWHGVAGLVMLACGCVFYLAQVYPLNHKLNQLRVAASGGGAKASANDTRRDLELFKASFRRGSLEDQLKEIHESGRATGLSFKRIEYRMLEEKRCGLRQYQITMPVTSSYPSIRQFSSLALAKMPGLSLDHISFQRKKIGDTMVEAELRFTLFLADPV